MDMKRQYVYHLINELQKKQMTVYFDNRNIGDIYNFIIYKFDRVKTGGLLTSLFSKEPHYIKKKIDYGHFHSTKDDKGDYEEMIEILEKNLDIIGCKYDKYPAWYLRVLKE